jgi:hydrogenase maturation protein HypF
VTGAVRFDVRGIVQGVGFRPWIYRVARGLGLTGRVWNHSRGVTIEVFGDPAALHAFATALRSTAPPAARLDAIDTTPLPSAASPATFEIVESLAESEREVSIPPDLATCAECLAEIADPAARRHRYPFTNCTNCGPRFTIALDVPYDRPATTMAVFPMCNACRAEYVDPGDRRFHAQPIACPDCGPRVRLLGPDGTHHDSGAPISDAATSLLSGHIVAVKGLGGYLLACDGTSSAAVVRLRARKRREEKPFAVMVRALDEAERLAVLSDEERRLLTSAEAPIVLCRARDDNGLVPEVAPRTSLVGVFLAYTPLHRILLDAVGRPLVMTSGNLSEEPLAYRDGEAAERLRGIADVFLAHDREIAAPCDDSVARVIAGAPMVFRRARGYVPRSLSLTMPVSAPVLACGALLKNTVCLAAGDRAWLGPHVGDLDSLATAAFFEESIDRLVRFTRITPEIFAHDLHPDLHSTRYAQDRGGAAAVAVQHHHAHVAAVMAEHGLAGPVLGVSYDGTGYGTDGASWGGEVLLVDRAGFERLATWRPLPLAGGDRAVHEVWRLALALLMDAFEDAAPIERFAVARDRAPTDLAVVRGMIERGFNAPPCHGVGRYFDAFGSLGLNRPESRFEGQVAVEWNQAGEQVGHAPALPFDLDSRGGVTQVDLREGVRAFASDLLAGVPAAELSARFHQTVVAATVALIARSEAEHGRLPIALTGGCFQNQLLTESLLRALGTNRQVWLPRQVPPGDGGISLGQVLVASRRLQEGRTG